jgi:peptide-methionine (R)-S-oxide reductase
MGLLWFFLLAETHIDKAFLGRYVYETSVGIYTCAKCNAELFSSEDKYDSGSGFPSFSKTIDPKKVYYLEDHTLSFKRYAVICRSCDEKLGHVFNDGPPPKGLRYSIHSSALHLKDNL